MASTGAALEERVARLEERMARIEGILEQMNERLGRVESDIRELRRLMLQIFIPMWVTIILAILAVMLRV